MAKEPKTRVPPSEGQLSDQSSSTTIGLPEQEVGRKIVTDAATFEDEEDSIKPVGPKQWTPLERILASIPLAITTGVPAMAKVINEVMPDTRKEAEELVDALRRLRNAAERAVSIAQEAMVSKTFTV